MKSPPELLYELLPYLPLLPLGIACWRWPYLDRPLRCFFFLTLGGTLNALLSVVWAKMHWYNHFFFYTSSLFQVGMYAILLVALKPDQRRIVYSLALAYMSYVGLEIALHGIRTMYLVPAMLANLFGIVCLLAGFRELFGSPHAGSLSRMPLVWIMSGALLGLLYSLFLCLVSSYLFDYANSRFFELLWVGVSPLLALFDIGVQALSFWQTKRFSQRAERWS